MEALLEGMQRNGQGGGFLTSCEAELQELMKQIDIMVAHKKSEWEGQTQALEACLSAREQELSSVRAALQEKEKEVEDLEKAKQDMVREFEQQLRKFQEELSRLRRSYEKLQKKKLREARGDASKRQGEDEFEISCLTRKLEEFHQKSLDWEKQRVLYQQQVASLEAQRKALAEQSELMQQSQLSGRRQMVESVELASQLEVQHLTSKLERASDALCASKLEVERLNVRVDSLTESSQMILEDQQRVQEELRQSKKMLEVLQDEKMELRATLQAQEDFIDRSKLHQEQLQKELARVTETLHRKELLIRALEERLQEKQVSSLGLEDGLLQLDVAQQKEQHLQPEVTHLEDSLVSLSCAQLGGELHERSQELQALEEHHPESKAEMEKLKEQLSQAEQTHSSELEEMKREISRLTQELQQRDITIASASGTTSDLEQRLRAEFERAEIERAERKAVEHRVLLVQLETLRLENRLLSEMLKKAECGMLEGKGVTLKALTEDYAAELNTLKSENQQLKKDLAEARAKVELAQQVCQDEGTAQQLQDKEPEARDVQYRVTREAQHKPDEQAERIPHTPDGTILHHQGEPQRWGAAETGAVTPATGELPTQSCRENCMESSALGAVLGVDSLLHVLDGNKDFAGEAPKQSILDEQRASVPLCLLPTASVGSIAARYLKEEELRSQHILECLNAHIEDLKKESEKIVREFGHQE
ncbi:centrosomal protein of 63 kDa isoform X3 [Apus apus]|uniref:centrosomal protein of 63 kDa isoform X3 n=1 Tax=Apus apus TaxID=8895 RepID=UPI0021F848DF|nr:centrosomal protein of 63 kDa isoform X3 [Apus apus]